MKTTRTSIKTDRWGFPLVVGQRVIGEGSPSHRRMMNGLALLLATRGPDQTFTTREIAKATGFDHEHISNITRQALRKLRRLLPPDARAAFMDHLRSK
jgi:hypothetical protein